MRNAENLYIPVAESIRSVLPLVDEFIVALGQSTDRTEEIIASIHSPKIKVIHTLWDASTYPKNTIYAQQTDVAKAHCTGDWLIYIQSDEALHEKDHSEIAAALQKYHHDMRVEAFVLNYNHFWGDYNHVHQSHAWYKKEIRIIRNLPQIHSYRDAQSFRFYSDFKVDDYSQYHRTDARKLNAIALQAEVYHYGFVRPPHIMSGKKRKTYASYHGANKGSHLLKDMPDIFDYGVLNRIPVFKGTHPAVMRHWLEQMDWAHLLQHSGKRNKNRLIHKHEKFKYRLISWIENYLLGGRGLFAFQNFKLLKR